MINIPTGAVSAVVLGIMQDAGLPHAGCRCLHCVAAFTDPGVGQRVACLALIDTRRNPAGVWLIDATPDIATQLNDLSAVLGPHPDRSNRLRQPDGIFLTHGHLGHVGGLPQLGPEGMAVAGMPVYASAGLAGVLKRSAIWQPVVNMLAWRALTEGVAVEIATGLSLTPLAVPHRDEWGAGTFAFRIRGPQCSLLYVPDIDTWADWPDARNQVAATDEALVDATFFSSSELGGRPPVAHPLVPDTLRFFDGMTHKLTLIHLNHTNPLLEERSPERAMVVETGAAVAWPGQVFSL
ncbi:MAG: MBL fold metallo-hydrolase [Chloroflexota bacterium]|jgi:pyrroloquinoline quinone biosynthesis protein B